MRLTDEYTEDIEPRYKYLLIIIGLFFFVVFCRLYYFQIIRGDFYRFFSTENSIKEIRIPTPRGVIYDRHRRVLVENRPAFDVVVIPQYVIDPPRALTTLTALLNISPEELTLIWESRKGQPSYQELVVRSDISFDEVSMIRTRREPWYDESNPFDLRGVEVRMRYQRTAPLGDIATHVLGYIREIDSERLKKYQALYPGQYQRSDQVGVRGIEEVWDVSLRGETGYEQRIVNAVGHEVDYAGIADQLQRRPASPGEELVLTIDRDLQQVARDQFEGKEGAAVAIDVEKGEVLVLFSAPTFDLNRLAGDGAGAYWKELANDPRKPLLNRAIQGVYPPASTYKIVTAVAALAEGEVSPSEEIFCSGAYRFGGRFYHCWRDSGHGMVNLHRAISQSCDVFFYVLGQRLGVDRLAHYAGLLGFGETTGISLKDEQQGLIPTSSWKEKKFGTPWQKGETLSIAVGQGYNLVTPLQNALMVARLANDGRLIHPLLHRSESTSKRSEEHLPIDEAVLHEVQKGMVSAVKDPGGTAHRLSLLDIPIGGKTGTAQVVSLEREEICRESWCRDHAWFVGFAPAEKPKIAIAVIVEHGGFGASAAAPIAGALFEKYRSFTTSD